MTPATLRRKMQKKLKHKPYLLCTHCGRMLHGILLDEKGVYRLLYRSNDRSADNKPYCFVEKTWTGGGIGRRIPVTGAGKA